MYVHICTFVNVSQNDSFWIHLYLVLFLYEYGSCCLVECGTGNSMISGEKKKKKTKTMSQETHAFQSFGIRLSNHVIFCKQVLI